MNYDYIYCIFDFRKKHEYKYSSKPQISLTHIHTQTFLFTSYSQSVQSDSSVSQSCPTLCNPMNRSMPGLPVHHQLLEFTDSRPSSQWCHPAISSWVVPFPSCPQSLPASESFTMSQLFTWGGQSTGVSASASFPPKESQGWSPSERTGGISLSNGSLWQCATVATCSCSTVLISTLKLT